MRWRVLSSVGLVLVCAASGLAGGYLTVRAFAPTVERFSFGTVRATAVPVADGRIDVYVPIVDWGVRASPFAAPVAIELRFQSLDRDEALAALRSGSAARARLDAIRGELVEVGRTSLERSAILVFAGGIAGGLLGGAVVGAALHRRQWLAYGAAAGLLAPLAFAAVVFATVRKVDYAAFEQPTFYAHGRELPRLLSFSGQLLTASETYTQSYEQALAGLANLVAFASQGGARATPTTSFVVASDLHANSLVLPVLEDYTRGKTVLMPGDFTLLGTEVERGLARQIGRLSTRILAVSGNHDSRPFMLGLVRAGVTVLTREGRLLPGGDTDGQPVIEVDGLGVAGYDDPLEGASDRIEARPLELSDEQFQEEAGDFVAWFDQLPVRPDIVLVHQHGLAHALVDFLEGETGPPLVIVTGHDHRQHVEETGTAVLVDGGTAGAGGPFAIGVQAAGFAVVHFTDEGRPQAADLIEVEPLSGNARARRITLPTASPEGISPESVGVVGELGKRVD
jgi:predicted phosphodiesterase